MEVGCCGALLLEALAHVGEFGGEGRRGWGRGADPEQAGVRAGVVALGEEPADALRKSAGAESHEGAGNELQGDGDLPLGWGGGHELDGVVDPVRDEDANGVGELVAAAEAGARLLRAHLGHVDGDDGGGASNPQAADHPAGVEQGQRVRVDDLEDDTRAENSGTCHHGETTAPAVRHGPHGEAAYQGAGLLNADGDGADAGLFGGTVSEVARKGLKGEHSSCRSSASRSNITGVMIED